MSKIKGTALASRFGYARRREGEEGVQRLVASICDAEVRESLADGKPLKNLWYPFEALIDVSLELDRMYGKGDLAILEDVGAEGAENDLSGVYKIFFKVASPFYIIEKAGTVWRSYYDSGELKVIDRGACSTKVEVLGFDAPHRAHCLAVLGWMTRCVEMTGCKNVVAAHTACRAQGDARCVFEASWDA